MEKLDKTILSGDSIFGGGCDPYEFVNTVGEKKCNVNYSPGLASSSVLRQAKVAEMCLVLYKNPDSALFALRKVKSNSSTDSFKEMLKKAYAMFHQKRAPSKEVLVELEKIIKNASGSDVGWKEVFLVLCQDPSWQVL